METLSSSREESSRLLMVWRKCLSDFSFSFFFQGLLPLLFAVMIFLSCISVFGILVGCFSKVPLFPMCRGELDRLFVKDRCCALIFPHHNTYQWKRLTFTFPTQIQHRPQKKIIIRHLSERYFSTLEHEVPRLPSETRIERLL